MVNFLECGCKPPDATSRLQTLKSTHEVYTPWIAGGLYKTNIVKENPSPTIFTALAYPNPTDNIVNIATNLKTDEPIEIVVIDAMGNQILKQTCITSQHNCKINLVGQAKGIYLFKIINPKTNEQVTTKVVLQ
jgi:Secretion system C-terminal sorting domain